MKRSFHHFLLSAGKWYFVRTVSLITVFFFHAATSEMLAQRKMESIDRGLVAMKISTGVFLSWRILGNEFSNTGYNLFRNGSLIASFTSTDASNFSDVSGTSSSTYYIKAVVNGVEQSASPSVNVWSSIYKEIPLNKPAIGPKGGSYEPNECSTADLDGDGQYEIVLKWQPTNAQDNSNSGYTDNTYLDGYELDGTFLWRIDLGLNIRAGAHYSPFMVYDLDGDGKAELVCKTAPGTVDGTGAYLSGAAAGTSNSTDYRNTDGRVLDGPEYLTVFSGLTGKELQTIIYEPIRGVVADWGDSYGNRCDRFLACVAYLNGKTPSVVLSRGYYGKTVLVAYDWNGTTLTKVWKFDSTVNGNSAYEGQGNHNLSVADVDNDGFDELIYGSCTIDHDGTGKYSTGLKHGDALHVGDLDPDRPGYEVWQAHEEGSVNGGVGASFRDAKTGEVLFYDPASFDVGRGLSANFSPSVKGDLFWSVASSKLWSVKGLVVGSTPLNINPLFAAYWDGNDQREIIDGASCTNVTNGRVITFYNYGNAAAVSGSKNNPCLQADIIGDWREEEIYRSSDNTKLVVFSTTSPTTRRIYTLMHDPVYRMGVAWQNVGYNQPPHTGFYIGTGMGSVPPSSVIGEDIRWSGNNAVWDVNSNQSWFSNASLVGFQQNMSVLFDQFGQNGTVANSIVAIMGSVTPRAVSICSATDYSFSGTGSITGTTSLIKNGSGKLTISNSNTFTGVTTIWDGCLLLNGTSSSPVHVNGGIWGGISTKGTTGGVFGGKGTLNANLTVNEKGAIAPGNGNNAAGRLNINGNVQFNKSSYGIFDVSNTSSGVKDTLSINGNLNITDTISQFVNALNGALEGGDYPLITYTGSLTGNPATISIVGLEGTPCSIYQSGKTIGIRIKATRTPSNVFWSGVGQLWDLATSANWVLKGSTDQFVPQDSVTFNGVGYASPDDTPPVALGENGLLSGGTYNSTINIPYGVTLPVSGMLFDAGATNITISGAGSVTGLGGLIKKGKGKLTMLTQNGYIGKTLINGGCIEVGSLYNAGLKSAIGATLSTDPSYFELNNASLRYSLASTIITDRGLTLSGISDTIAVEATSMYLKGLITGSGKLVKIGSGSLTLQQHVNTFVGGVVVKEGTLNLGDDIANRYGMGPQSTNVTLEGGTLSLFSSDSYNSTYFNMIVPNGTISNYHADYRSDNYGSLTGSGTLNMYIPYVRTTLYGNWSDFTGQLNLYFDSQESSSEGDFRIANDYGYAKAAINLKNSKIKLMHVSGATVSIGELAGVIGSELTGSNWIIGAKNTDATFDGKILSNSITKVGIGTLTLTDTCYYTNPTIVNSGRIVVSGVGHLKGGVTVNTTGTLGGKGSIAGASTVDGSLEGSLRFGNTLTLNGTATTNLTVNGFTPGQYDLVQVVGKVTLGGILNVQVATAAPALGSSIKLIGAATYAGSFSSVHCPGYSFDPTNGNLTYTGHHVSGTTSYATSTIPENADLTVDNGILTVDKAGVLSNLALMPGAKLSLQSGRQFPASKIQLKSDESGTATFINDNTNGQSVSAIVQQYLSAGRNWYLAIPITSVDSSVLSTSAKAIICYDEPTATWKSPTTAILSPLKGYISVSTKTSGPITFSGILNDGVQTTTLTRTYGVAKSGFNLVGNPYPSYVNWDMAENSNLETTIWYRTRNASNTSYVFDTYNSASQVGTANNGDQINGHIPPMQAFWVRVKPPVLAHDTIGTLTFRNSMRSHKDTIADGNTKPDVNLRSLNLLEDKQQVLRIQVANERSSDETIILFNSKASNEMDDFDSYKMSNSNLSQPELYTNVGSEKMVINGLNSLKSINYTIPLGFTTGEFNTYTIKATELSNFDDVHIYLKDQVTGIETELSVADSYRFTSSAISTSSRFSLFFRLLGTSYKTFANEQVVDIYSYNNLIAVHCSNYSGRRPYVTIHNAMGQKVYMEEITSNDMVLKTKLNSGIYLVTVNNGYKSKTKKVVLQ